LTTACAFTLQKQTSAFSHELCGRPVYVSELFSK
jgi:hypothetical protein